MRKQEKRLRDALQEVKVLQEEKERVSNLSYLLTGGIIGGILIAALAVAVNTTRQPEPTVQPVSTPYHTATLEDITAEPTDPTALPTIVQTVLPETSVPTARPSETPIPTIVTPTKHPDYVNWLWSDILEESTARITLDDGQFLLLGASSYILGEKQCYQANDRLCAYIKEVDGHEVVTLRGYTPGHAWVGIADAYSADAILKEKSPQFWDSPNCEIGCGHAMVIIDHKDGCREQFVLYPGNSREYIDEKCQ